jgi:hypothetical protein
LFPVVFYIPFTPSFCVAFIKHKSHTGRLPFRYVTLDAKLKSILHQWQQRVPEDDDEYRVIPPGVVVVS